MIVPWRWGVLLARSPWCGYWSHALRPLGEAFEGQKLLLVHSEAACPWCSRTETWSLPTALLDVILGIVDEPIAINCKLHERHWQALAFMSEYSQHCQQRWTYFWLRSIKRCTCHKLNALLGISCHDDTQNYLLYPIPLKDHHSASTITSKSTWSI